MKQQSNTLTIIRKEFARFFGDRSLLFTSVIMPGLLIYVIYSLMGAYLPTDEELSGSTADKTETVSVNTLTDQEEALLDSLLTVKYTSEQESDEDTMEELGGILGKLIPMLIIMLLFSGSMAVAPSAIAGEKERGTIATLLVTPMRRSELALGKIVSLSCFALLSGLSSFLGIILSLPKMIHSDGISITTNIYGAADYAVILLMIFSTVLIIISIVSIFSALAKDTKSAGTMITPVMLIVMFLGISPMITTPSSTAMYLIPIFNSAQAMSAVFSFKMELMPVLVTVASNLVYTALAVFVLTKLFNSEKVMFSK